MTSSGCSMRGGPSKEGKGTNRTGGSTILKLIWGGNLLYFAGFRNLQPYETWKFRICSESVTRVSPDLFRISIRKCLTGGQFSLNVKQIPKTVSKWVPGAGRGQKNQKSNLKMTFRDFLLVVPRTVNLCL